MSAPIIYTAPIGHPYGQTPHPPPPPAWNPTHHIPHSPPPPVHAIPPQVSITPYWPNNSSPLLPISTLPGGAPPHMAPLSGLQKDLTTRILQNMIQYGGNEYFQVSLDRMGIIPSNKDLQQWMLQPRAYLDFMTLLRLAVCLRRLVEATKLAAGPALLRNVIWQFANYVVGLGIRMAPPHLNPPELSPKLGVTRSDLLQFLADLSIAIAQTRETPIATRFALYTLQLIAQYKRMESRGELLKESYSKLNLSDLVSAVVDWVVHDLNSQKGDTPTNPAMLPDLCECIRLLDSEEDKIRLTLRGLKHGLVQLETFVNFATALCPPNDPPVDEGSRAAYDMMHQTINEWQQKKRNREIDALLPSAKRQHIDDLPPLPPPPPQNKQLSRSSKSKAQKESAPKDSNSATKRHILLKEYNTLVLKGGTDPEAAAKLQKIRAAMEKLLNPEQHKQYGIMKKEYLSLKSQTDPPMSDVDRKLWRRKLEQFVLQCMAGS